MVNYKSGQFNIDQQTEVLVPNDTNIEKECRNFYSNLMKFLFVQFKNKN